MTASIATRPSRTIAAWALVAVLATVAAACSSSNDDTAESSRGATTGTTRGGHATSTTARGPEAWPDPEWPDPEWPDPEWEVADPAVAGADLDALEALVGAAEEAKSSCLVVTRGGRIVDERYWGEWDHGTTQQVFSATKSVTSTLVGIAQSEGLLSIEDPAANYISEWDGTESETVTVRNLLSNDSGRFYDDTTDYVDMAVAAPDKTQFAIDLSQQHEPGTTWKYNNSAIQTLEQVLEEATGGDVAAYAQEKLFGPIGMDVEMDHDVAGNTLTFMGLHASCRDLARFGLLHLRGGEWNGVQIVPAEWVEEATTPSQDLNGAYGYLWWLNAGNMPGRTPDGSGDGASDTSGHMAPDASTDIYAAIGLGDQLVEVFPSLDVVVTRIGPVNVPAGTPSFGFRQIADLTEDVFPTT